MGGVGVWVGGHVGVGVVRVAWWVCLDEWGGGRRLTVCRVGVLTVAGLHCPRQRHSLQREAVEG